MSSSLHWFIYLFFFFLLLIAILCMYIDTWIFSVCILIFLYLNVTMILCNHQCERSLINIYMISDIYQW